MFRASPSGWGIKSMPSLCRRELFSGDLGAGRSGPEGTELNCSVRGSGAAGGPGESGVEVGDIDEVEAADLLLRVGVRAVKNLRFAVGDVHGGRRGGGLETVRCDPDTSVLESLGVGRVRGGGLLLVGLGHAVPTAFFGIKHQHILHGKPRVYGFYAGITSAYYHDDRVS